MKKTSRVRAMRRCAALALGAGLWATANTAQALLTTCTVSASGLAFGAYQPLTFAGKLTSVDRTSTATVTVVCRGLLSLGGYTISLGASSYGPGNRISTRYLNNTTSGGDYMAFNVFTEATYTTIWGDGTNGSRISGSAPLILGQSTQTYTVYGKIPAGQNTLKAGSFSDSPIMTLTYNP